MKLVVEGLGGGKDNKGMILPRNFHSLLPNLQWSEGRNWLLPAHIPLLFGCRFYKGKILQITKPWEGSY